MATAAEAKELDSLYKSDEILSNAETDAAAGEKAYRQILTHVKGSNKAKQMAGQLIPKFFQKYPGLFDEALNAQLDLCEEDELGIRLFAIRGLPALAANREFPDHLNKVADVLAQLLNAEEHRELDQVNQALIHLVRQDVKGVINALFKHIGTEEEELRKKCILFLNEKILNDNVLRKAVMNPEAEDVLAEKIQAVLSKVNEDEFTSLFRVLRRLNKYKGAGKGDELAAIVAGTVDLEAAFDPTNEAQLTSFLSALAKVLNCTRQGDTVNKFIGYIAQNILPRLTEVPPAQQTTLLRRLLSLISGKDGNTTKPLLVPVYKALLASIPAPAEGTTVTYNYAVVENLLFIFTRLASQSPLSLYPVCGIKLAAFTGQPSDFNTEYGALRTDLDARLDALLTAATASRTEADEQLKVVAAEKKSLYEKSAEQDLKLRLYKKKKEAYDKLVDAAKKAAEAAGEEVKIPPPPEGLEEPQVEDISEAKTALIARSKELADTKRITGKLIEIAKDLKEAKPRWVAKSLTASWQNPPKNNNNNNNKRGADNNNNNKGKGKGKGKGRGNDSQQAKRAKGNNNANANANGNNAGNQGGRRNRRGRGGPRR